MILFEKSWTKIEDILNGIKIGKIGNFCEWIYRIRSSGNIVFMVIRDATSILQATIKKANLFDSEFFYGKKVLIESSLELKGIVKEDKCAPGGYEFQVTGLNII